MNKGNPNHGKDGKFTSAENATGSTGGEKLTKKLGSMGFGPENNDQPSKQAFKRAETAKEATYLNDRNRQSREKILEIMKKKNPKAYERLKALEDKAKNNPDELKGNIDFYKMHADDQLRKNQALGKGWDPKSGQTADEFLGLEPLNKDNYRIPWSKEDLLNKKKKDPIVSNLEKLGFGPNGGNPKGKFNHDSWNHDYEKRRDMAYSKGWRPNQGKSVDEFLGLDPMNMDDYYDNGPSWDDEDDELTPIPPKNKPMNDVNNPDLTVASNEKWDVTDSKTGQKYSALDIDNMIDEAIENTKNFASRLHGKEMTPNMDWGEDILYGLPSGIMMDPKVQDLVDKKLSKYGLGESGELQKLNNMSSDLSHGEKVPVSLSYKTSSKGLPVKRNYSFEKIGDSLYFVDEDGGYAYDVNDLSKVMDIDSGEINEVTDKFISKDIEAKMSMALKELTKYGL